MRFETTYKLEDFILNTQGQETLIRLLATEQDVPIREIIHAANDFANYK